PTGRRRASPPSPAPRAPPSSASSPCRDEEPGLTRHVKRWQAGASGRRMIKSFADHDTERVFRRERVRRLPSDLLARAYRKLLMLDAATQLRVLRVPPGNRPEALHGVRKRLHNNRIHILQLTC